jgi:1,4-alpha-glucan branching enzyme
MRILHVTPYYEQAWAYGGIPRAVTALARAQALAGHHVEVASSDAADSTARATRGGDPGVHLFPNVSNWLAYHLQLFTPMGFGRWLLRNDRRFDVVHVHGCHHLLGALVAWRAREQPRYVLSPHGTAPRIERRIAAKWAFDSTIGRPVLRRAWRLIAVSEAERRQLRALGVDDARIRTAANALEAAYEPAALERLRRSPEPGRAIVFLGKLTPRKRVDVLMRAFAALGRGELRLIIAGNDLGAGAQLRALADVLGIAPQVRWTGLLRGDDRLAELGCAEVVVLPSSDEVFGLAAAEALSLGVPVVVADDSGCGELVSSVGGGLCVPPGDAGALSDALRSMLADRDRWHAEAARASQRLRETLAPARIAERVVEIYGEASP